MKLMYCKISFIHEKDVASQVQEFIPQFLRNWITYLLWKITSIKPLRLGNDWNFAL